LLIFLVMSDGFFYCYIKKSLDLTFIHGVLFVLGYFFGTKVSKFDLVFLSVFLSIHFSMYFLLGFSRHLELLNFMPYFSYFFLSFLAGWLFERFWGLC